MPSNNIKERINRIKEKAQTNLKEALSETVRATSALPSMAGEQKIQDNDTNKTLVEQTQSPNRIIYENSTTYDARVDFYPVTYDSKNQKYTLNFNGDEYNYSQDKTRPKKLSRQWRQEEAQDFKEAGPDQIITITDPGEILVGGSYSPSQKNITLHEFDITFNEFEEYYSDEYEDSQIQMAWNAISNHNKNLKDIRIHEEQHRTNDKLGIYAPGLSPEQYGILNQYDECSAKIAELNSYITDYKKALKEGKSKDEALQVFDNQKGFTFYKEALTQGLDPDSKEGRELMVQGTINMWQKNYQEFYQPQTFLIAQNGIFNTDAASLIIGNEKELQKRINMIFDNINNNNYSRKNGVKSPLNLSRYLPEEQMGLTPTVQQAIDDFIKGTNNLSPETRDYISDNIRGRTDKQKNLHLIQLLTGRKSADKVFSKQSNPNLQNNNIPSQMMQSKKQNSY